MREIVIAALERITKEKEDSKRFPTHVMYTELVNELGREIDPVLRKLWYDGKIKAGNTINDKYIELIPNNTANEQP